MRNSTTEFILEDANKENLKFSTFKGILTKRFGGI